MWMALSIRTQRETATTVVDAMHLAMPVRRIYLEVFGEEPSREGRSAWTEGRIASYVEHGLSSPELDRLAGVRDGAADFEAGG